MLWNRRRSLDLLQQQRWASLGRCDHVGRLPWHSIFCRCLLDYNEFLQGKHPLPPQQLRVSLRTTQQQQALKERIKNPAAARPALEWATTWGPDVILAKSGGYDGVCIRSTRRDISLIRQEFWPQFFSHQYFVDKRDKITLQPR